MEKFADIKYERPDVPKLRKEYRACIEKLKNAGSFEEADAAVKGMERVVDRISTLLAIASIRHGMNTKDAFYAAEKRFFDRSVPRQAMLLKKGTEALLNCRFRKELEEKYGTMMFKNAESQLKFLKPSAVLPMIAENRLVNEYFKVTAQCSVEFRGEACTARELNRHMQSTDREERREAYGAYAKLSEEVSPKLEEIYGKLLKVRTGLAKKLGFKSYIDFAYRNLQRYDYGPDDVARFRETVRDAVVPVCDRLYREQAERLGIDKIRFYDEYIAFPDGNAVPEGTPEDLCKKARLMYEDLSPETGEFFNFMTEYGLFDLSARKNKIAGAFTDMMPEYKAPFIFSSFNKTAGDVLVLTHEAGHAFELYHASRCLPHSDLTRSTNEIGEIHSMAMELFTYPYMEYFFGDSADRFRFSHLCEALASLADTVAVDEFQHRVYENPDSTPSDWRKFWRQIEKKYMPWRDYGGNGFFESGGFWTRTLHVFACPFYYIEYALAQIDAFYLYRKAEEGGDAWGDYLKLCSMGGKYGYFETLEKAGLPNPLKPETVKDAVKFVEKRIGELEEKIK
ncbi:MAG: M3 family oligoendopeptidase [Clostridia bacterium]|nr:M3 family oligoendopeptidase [Clostridia bacterium]